ncbi:MAG: gliding motility-associated C-terminal domain-containing protein [Bacteroidales bacterium]|nr:gliding motility-associated C-terminal domain-containing protein [Bacteroidales bacterium]
MIGIFMAFSSVFSQSTVWYFGQNAGISFSANGVPTAISSSQMNTPEGCATHVSTSGQLEYYSNGESLWLANGSQIANNLDGNMNAIQSATFISKPYDNDTVYLFTLDSDIGINGLKYSVLVDNAIVVGMKNIPLMNNVTERMCIVQHCNNHDSWLIVHAWNSNNFYAYRINGEGVDTVPVISSVGSEQNGNLLNATGYLKVNKLGDRVAMAVMGSGKVELFHFDNINGVLSTAVSIDNIPAAYGVEFNESGSVLYVTSASGKLYNYDLSIWSENAIETSRSLVFSSNNQLGALQMGPNNNIYVAQDNSFYVGRIASPDFLGLNCNYSSDYLYLMGNKCEAGLPPFVSYTQNFDPIVTSVCIGDTTSFELLGDSLRIDSVKWDFGIIPNVGSTKLKTKYLYSASGDYSCSLLVYHCNETDTFTFSAEVLSISPVDLGNDTAFCDYDSIILDANMSSTVSYLWDDGSIQPTMLVSSVGVHWVKITSLCGVVSDTILITDIWESPKLNLPNDTILCSGDTLLLDAGNVFEHFWQGSNNNQIYVVKDSGWVSLTVKDTNNCMASSQFYVNIENVPQADLGNDTTICQGNEITLNGGEAQGYQWHNQTVAQYFRTRQAGTYSVKLYNQCGSTIDSINVRLSDCQEYIVLPNAFTPNGDNLNDVFLPKTLGISYYEMHIYNRLGHEVFMTKDLNHGWDGKTSGEDVIEGVYAYIIRYRKHNGNLLLKRGYLTLIR